MTRYRPWKTPVLENKPEKNKKFYPGQRINYTADYECKECGEKFRLKFSLMNHKCRGFKICKN